MADRRQYRLSILPVDYSLTAGTMIPAPLDSPPESPVTISHQPPTDFVRRPPTPHGGPLSSHPTCPEDYAGIVFPPTPEADKENIPHRDLPKKPATNKRQRQPSIFKLPTSPASASPPSFTEPQRRPSVVRKLLSLSSLRSSFNSSRTSISLPMPLGSHIDDSSPNSYGFKRPTTPSVFSITPSLSGSPQPNSQPRPVLHHRKSSSWFKRKSSMLMGMDDNDSMTTLNETSRPDTRDSKRIKVLRPAPSIPELQAINDQRLGSGEIGWDERQFE